MRIERMHEGLSIKHGKGVKAQNGPKLGTVFMFGRDIAF